MSGIVERLRAMARCEHDDLSVGEEAAAEIDRLRADLDRLTSGTWSKELARLSSVNENLRAALAEAERLLDSGTIRLVQRDDYGQVGFHLYAGIDLRKCIAEALDAAPERKPMLDLTPVGPGRTVDDALEERKP